MFIDVPDVPDARCKRSTQAAILARLPSHRALSSDQGYTLSRTLERARRRLRSQRSRMHSDSQTASFTDIEYHPDVLSERTLSKRRNKQKWSKTFEVPGFDEIDAAFEFLRNESIRSMTTSISVKRRYR